MTQSPNPGRVAFVGSGPGDPGLLTVRAREALAGAPLVVTDSDVPDQILALAAELLDMGGLDALPRNAGSGVPR